MSMNNRENNGGNGDALSDSSDNGQTGEKWREDFPVEWVADNYITRREFTKFLIMTSGAMVAGNGYFVARGAIQAENYRNVDPVKIADENELPVGGVKLFRFPTPDDPALLIRLDADRYVAFRQRCTHLSCPVHFNAEHKRLDCPCHHGAFDAENGRVLYGPPPRPLPMIALTVGNGEVLATGLLPQAGEEGHEEGGGEA